MSGGAPQHRRKLRLAFFGARGIPHTYGGADAFFLELCPRLVERGHDVIVYNRSSLFKEKPPEYRGVRIIYLPSIETKSLGTPTHTLACAIDVLFRKVDAMLVVNVGNSFHCIIPRLFRKHVAINVDGLDWKRDKWGRLAKWYFHLNAKWVGRIVPDGVITDATEMQRIYLEDFNTCAANIAYGANIETSTNPDAVRQYGLEPGQYYLIASRLVPENNADLIVRGFEKLKTNKLLAIAGNANYKSKFVEDLKQTRDPRVKFLGHIDDADHVKELHCNAYAYVHGHMMGGTNPALVKALGYGNFILALNTLFNAEVLAEYGVLFDMDADSLARTMQHYEDHPELASTFRARAPQRIREAYTWEHITDQYEEYFYSLIEGKKPSHAAVAALKHQLAAASK